MVGYRYFDTRNIEPQFPFGFGLSYTHFKFGHLVLDCSQGKVTARMTVQNCGDRAGSETIQVYVHELHPPVQRPVHELKAFQKIRLAPGEASAVEFELDRAAFTYYSAQTHQWEFHPDTFEIQVGDSSRHILLTGDVSLSGFPDHE